MHYTIGSACGLTGYDVENPKSPIVEVSIDDQNWVEVDSENDSSELDGRDIARTFDVAQSAEGLSSSRAMSSQITDLSFLWLSH
jgi:hypothetical protein